MKLKTFFLVLLLGGSYLLHAQTVEPTWESLNQRPYPQWFADAKLGIFIHWGLYSVPAYCGKEQYAEWYYKGLMVGDSNRIRFQEKNWGKGFQYRDFDKLFTPELFNPNEWAALFAESGAKYVLLVTKHHDGYCLWDSKYAPNWNSVSGGPKRNIVAELTEAVRAKNLKMGFYYSLPEWTNPLHIWTVDPHDSIANYVEKHMIPQFKELVSTYHPSVIFADGEWFNNAQQWHAAELIAWYYNTVGPDAIVNDRWGAGSNHGFRTPEYSSGITLTDRPWAECRGLGRSFGLNRNEPLSNYLTSDELIRHFVKLVAAGGGMTLNVGPAADGQIPLIQQERLLDLGKWLKLNGEAIYGAKPFSHFYENEKITLSRVDTLINFNWVRNSPHYTISYDNFSAEWTGFITPDYSEEYTFEVQVDDAVTIVIDGQTIIDFDRNALNAAESNAQETQNDNQLKGSIKLIAGKKYPITISYKENNLEAVMKLYWSSKSQPKTIVPSNALSGTTEKGLDVTYSCYQPYICYTVNNNSLYAIAIKYPDEQLMLTIDKPTPSTKVTLLGCEKELPWQYVNGQMIIDTRNLQYSDIKSTAAWVFKITTPTHP